jgi:hypothetical protein
MKLDALNLMASKREESAIAGLARNGFNRIRRQESLPTTVHRRPDISVPALWAPQHDWTLLYHKPTMPFGVRPSPKVAVSHKRIPCPLREGRCDPGKRPLNGVLGVSNEHHPPVESSHQRGGATFDRSSPYARHPNERSLGPGPIHGKY